MKIYAVQPGDTIDAIADSFQVPVQTLIYDNQLVAPYELAIGQSLLIENILTEPDPSQGAPLRTPLISFGYAYPFISPWILEQTLPFLSALHVFSYGFTQEGILVPPPQDDRWMIDLAVSYHVLPVLTLTPLGADGLFDNRLITSVVQNPFYKETLIRQLILTLEQKNTEAWM